MIATVVATAGWSAIPSDLVLSAGWVSGPVGYLDHWVGAAELEAMFGQFIGGPSEVSSDAALWRKVVGIEYEYACN